MSLHTKKNDLPRSLNPQGEQQLMTALASATPTPVHARLSSERTDLSVRFRLSRSPQKTALDMHFNETPLWQCALKRQQQGSILLPVCSMLLFLVFGLGLCYQVTA